MQEWEWPQWSWSADALRLGALGASRRHVVRARLHNAGPVPLCGVKLGARLEGGEGELSFALQDKAECVGARTAAHALLTLVTPAAEGALRGAALLHTRHTRAHHAVSLHAYRGTLLAHTPCLPGAAPVRTHTSITI